MAGVNFGLLENIFARDMAVWVGNAQKIIEVNMQQIVKTARCGVLSFLGIYHQLNPVVYGIQQT
jgi:hypothetical protein